ncbi:MAG: heme/copper-type cytochrome/quinol oxidase, subunit 1 [Nitrosospira multiformis]|jgi:hypothetical protein|nr:heme/copper-type cytochrome/quinol oxidase, subunit 1 [Nitrosospira multiformis]
MDLKSEIDKIKNVWSQASPLGKVYHSLSFYLSISTIASLSETVIKWKGFFRDALTFYHQFIREPLHKIFFDLKLDLVPELIDYLVIYTLLISSFLRVLFVERKNDLEANRIINRKLGMQLCMGIVFIALTFRMERIPSISALALASIPIFAIFLLSIYLGREQKRAFYIPLLCAVSTVGILAAINAGLSG